MVCRAGTSGSRKSAAGRCVLLGFGYYANAVARKIVELNPQIQPVFEAWKKQGVKKETLWSELEKNQELKSLLLAETPWLAQAADEQEQRQRIGLLFDLNTMNYRMGRP